MLSPKNKKWLTEFRKRNNRPPNVLHIGNIANNAYNNAKILNKAGIKNTVICYDYYHIMGCPEWEDADFEKFKGNPFRPDWQRMNIKVFKRPAWFYQAPLKVCLLKIKEKSKKRNTALLKILNLACEKNTVLYKYLFKKNTLWALPLISYFIISRLIEKAKNLVRQILTNTKKINENVKINNSLIKNFISKKLKKIFILNKKQTFLKKIKIQRFPLFKLLSPLKSYFNQKKYFSIKKSKIQKKGKNCKKNITLQSFFAKKTVTAYREFFDNTVYFVPLRKIFRKTPENTKRDDFLPFLSILGLWKRFVFPKFDFIIGYSTDALWPFLAGVPYFAFEHGTLRSIPFEKTPRGRLCQVSYRSARHVFVTNIDCVGNAKKICPKRFTFINHPFDEDHGLRVSGWVEWRQKVQKELKSDFILFHPTRHDWVDGSGFADKANHLFLGAFCDLRNQGMNIGLICCEWGSNVKESKAILDQRMCSKHVKWVKPFPVVAFERTCLASDIVIDQFKLGAFGGVLIKCMAVGRPVLTFLEEKQVLKQYVKLPPVINCRTQKEITDAIAHFFHNRQKLKKLGEESRAWIKKYHNRAATVNAQVDQFRLLAKSERQRADLKSKTSNKQ